MRRRDPHADLRLQRALRRADDEAKLPGTPRRPGARLPIGTIRLEHTADEDMLAGIHTLRADGVSGVMPRDMVTLFPLAPLAAGFAIHHAIPSAPDTLLVTLTTPEIPAGKSFSIDCRVLAMR